MRRIARTGPPHPKGRARTSPPSRYCCRRVCIIRDRAFRFRYQTIPEPPERPENPPCLPLTLSLCFSGPSDYVLRVRNDSSVAVSVVPWDGAPASVVAPGVDEIVSSSGYPPPPWRVVVEELASGR